VALTLRLLCGLSTAEVARAFLVGETTMAARITRAKKNITAARIPYRVPAPIELASRVHAVCEVVHLLFTTGHAAPTGANLIRRDLIERSVDLARMLRALLPGNHDVAGLLALILLTDARRDARLNARTRGAARRPGPPSLGPPRDRRRCRPRPRGAASPPTRAIRTHGRIVAVHDESPTWNDTDWREVLGLYDLLIQLWPSPVVALNRAVALGFADGPAAGLDALDPLTTEPQLAGYGYLAAARADFLRRLGRTNQARTAYEEALLLTENTTERAYLSERLEQL